jgi:TatD DNase family protein
MRFVDTHCHIQSAGVNIGERSTRDLWSKDQNISVETLVSRATDAGVQQMICVGCDLDDSKLAIATAQEYDNLYASIGLHPHEAQHYAGNSEKLSEFVSLASQNKVIAVGECGLDFYYEYSPKNAQIQVLEFQLDIATKHNLPVIFHVRDAFDDFWPVLANFQGIRGVLHSFTDNMAQMEKAVSKGLYIGVNGIATFTKQSEQLEMYRSIPIENLVLETDAPFLTPVPFRGTICEPKHVVLTARFLSEIRGVTTEEIALATTYNAQKLFNL